MPEPLPLVVELSSPPEPEPAFRRWSQLPHVLFLDSALRHAELGRYSFLAADPFEYLELPIESANLDALKTRLNLFRASTVPHLPPFQGGAAGLLSYELGRSLERLPAPRFDEFAIPALAVGLYDVVLAFDHVQHRAWLISQGFPETEPNARRSRAAARLAQFQEWLSGSEKSPRFVAPSNRLARSELAPGFSVPGPEGLLSNFSQGDYLRAAARAVDYIHAGDVFQVNLAQRLLYPAHGAAADLYLRLRKCNPATFAAYFDLGDTQIVSASPERFVSVRGSEAEARPIKGTRRRSLHPEADLFAGDDLRQSEKDRAENVMIVDLLRNDLSRVCTADSVRVTELCRLETYQYVQHLVSAVRGTLAPGRTAFDLVRAAFPGGSITGAPKVRAMEIIAELEPTARGAYCGSVGYFGFDGALDLSILIRTITASRGWWQMPVGGGIVAQSDPAREYEETWHKARGLLQALR